MSNETISQALAAIITTATGRAFSPGQRHRALGGDASQASVLTGDDGRRFFVKLDRAAAEPLLAAEAAGLEELAQSRTISVPAVIAVGNTQGRAYLVIEHIDLRRADRGCLIRFGEALAELHGIVAPRHGWHHDNLLGATHQYNTPHGDWLEFWRENRLAVMLDALAGDEPALARDGDRLLSVLPTLLAGHAPEPSLLHGDLWSGNMAMDEAGRPVIYDPAVYYGDRETDLAMTELFGGFGPAFYEAYWASWPMRAEYREIRRPLYQLYHLLNHARLFGSSYVAPSQRIMRQLTAMA